MPGKPHGNSVALILSISLAQETQQEQVINLVISMTLFMVIAFFVSSCMGFNSPEYFRKGLFCSQPDKISFSSLCHTALISVRYSFLFPMSLPQVFFTTCSLQLVPFQLPQLLLTILGMKRKSQEGLIIYLNIIWFSILTWGKIADLPGIECDDPSVFEAQVEGKSQHPKSYGVSADG